METHITHPEMVSYVRTLSRVDIKMDKLFIYGLQDPRNGQLRYVGRTRSLSERLREHLKYKGRCHKTSWIQSLKQLGLKPEIFVIEETNEDRWQEDEKFWISYFRYIGCDLTNLTDGGEGVLNPSTETRKKKSEFMKGRIVSAETREKQRQSLLGKYTGEKNGNYGKSPSQETRAKISAALKGEKSPNYGKVYPKEFGEQISARQKGIPRTPEARAKQSKTMKGRPAKLRGEQIGNSKLTERAIIEIREMSAMGIRQSQIAMKYGVSKNLISLVLKRRIWKHVV